MGWMSIGWQPYPLTSSTTTPMTESHFLKTFTIIEWGVNYKFKSGQYKVSNDFPYIGQDL